MPDENGNITVREVELVYADKVTLTGSEYRAAMAELARLRQELADRTAQVDRLRARAERLEAEVSAKVEALRAKVHGYDRGSSTDLTDSSHKFGSSGSQDA